MVKSVQTSLAAIAVLSSCVYAQAPQQRETSVRDAIESVTKEVQKEPKTVDASKRNLQEEERSDKDARSRNASVREAIQSVTKQEEKALDIVESFKHMFKDGTVSGNIRSMYSLYDNDNETDTYATALGGQIKYELAKYKGFNAGFAFRTSQDLSFASGDTDEGKRNDELSSAQGAYTELTQAYIDYGYDKFDFRAGRQLIDTPLADSDDIRMIPNTFEAYVASYENESVFVEAGYLTKWQGEDAGLDSEEAWVKTGKDGVGFAGIAYGSDYLDANVWYYRFSNASKADIANGADANGNESFYIDAIGKYVLEEGVELHGGAQYLKQKELDNSGVEASIYGVMGELVIGGLGLNVAYNKAQKQEGKHSFSGYGGGTLFTNMDAMILDEITHDRDAQAVVAGFVYEWSGFGFLYAYGDFSGEEDASSQKAHIVEQNIGAQYTPNEEFTLGVIYVIDQNKEDGSSSDFNNKNLRVLLSYNF